MSSDQSDNLFSRVLSTTPTNFGYVRSGTVKVVGERFSIFHGRFLVKGTLSIGKNIHVENALLCLISPDFNKAKFDPGNIFLDVDFNDIDVVCFGFISSTCKPKVRTKTPFKITCDESIICFNDDLDTIKTETKQELLKFLKFDKKRINGYNNVIYEKMNVSCLLSPHRTKVDTMHH
jgi:hypothetical protein